jgi:superfamily I DNA and/or RNA helicase
MSTVDAFEGREAEVVIVSLANTESAGFIDFRRANVGMSRVREEMFLVGDRAFWKKNAPDNIRRLEELAITFPFDSDSDDESDVARDDANAEFDETG